MRLDFDLILNFSLKNCANLIYLIRYLDLYDINYRQNESFYLILLVIEVPYILSYMKINANACCFTRYAYGRRILLIL